MLIKVCSVETSRYSLTRYFPVRGLASGNVMDHNRKLIGVLVMPISHSTFIAWTACFHGITKEVSFGSSVWPARSR